MFTKKVKSRIFLLIIFLIFLATVIFITIKSLEENLVYFFSPSEIYNKSNISFDEKIRVGGLVKIDSVKKKGESI